MKLWSLTGGALALIAAVIGASCVPKSGGAGQPSLTADIDERIAEASAIRWSAERRLTWDDFRATPPPAPGDEGARTAYSLFWGARCAGKRFEFRAFAALLPRLSWVTPGVLRDPALNTRSLRHEQTHFDLSEVHARRMRRYFAGLAEPCGRTEVELNALSERFVKDEAAAQQRYDTETNYGRVPARQTAWDADTARQIAALEQYAAR